MARNAHVIIGDKVVIKYNILTTQMFVHEVYEPTTIAGGHSTIRHGADYGVEGWLGRVGTGRLPAEIEALRGGARVDAYRALRQAQYVEAMDLIHRAFPETVGATEWRDGEIVTIEPVDRLT